MPKYSSFDYAFRNAGEKHRSGVTVWPLDYDNGSVVLFIPLLPNEWIDLDILASNLAAYDEEYELLVNRIKSVMGVPKVNKIYFFTINLEYSDKTGKYLRPQGYVVAKNKYEDHELTDKEKIQNYQAIINKFNGR